MIAEAKTLLVDINMQCEMADAIEKRAAAIHLTSEEYCHLVLSHWLDSGQELSLAEL